MTKTTIKYPLLLVIVLHNYRKLVFVQAALFSYQGYIFKLILLNIFIGQVSPYLVAGCVCQFQPVKVDLILFNHTLNIFVF